MDYLDQEFQIFKDSTRRVRWFTGTLVLISVLILLHVYLDAFSLQTEQLRGIHAFRIKHHMDAVQSCLKDLALHLQRGEDGIKSEFPMSCGPEKIPQKDLAKLNKMSTEEIRELYSNRQYTMSLVDNSLKDQKLRPRQIPLLSMDIPETDFVTVMTVMSLVFMVGIFVNIRTLDASIAALVESPNSSLLRVIRLNMVFVGANPRTMRRGARVIKTLALWLPFLAVFVAASYSFWGIYDDLFKTNQGYFGPKNYIAAHFGVTATVLVLHFGITVACRSGLTRIDRLLYEGRDSSNLTEAPSEGDRKGN